jgi:hypothetical protein
MSRWIKPSELPKGFHNCCWVCKKDWFDSSISEAKLLLIQNHYRGSIPEYWCDIRGGWEYLSDENYRVMVIEKPNTITDEEWG